MKINRQLAPIVMVQLKFCKLRKIWNMTLQIKKQHCCIFIKFLLMWILYEQFVFEKQIFHTISPQFPPPLKLEGGGGVLFLKFGQRGGHEKLTQKQGVRKGGGFPNCFYYYWNTFFFFFGLVNIHACCKQQIYFMWFTLYQKMTYYEIYSPVTLIFKQNFVKFLL